MKLTTPLLTLLLPSLAQAGINWDVFEHGVVDTFRWSRPFPDDGSDPGGFDVHCKHTATFRAKMYKLRDLHTDPPQGLSPWRYAIEDFLTKIPYVGSWDGVDHKGEDREIVVMEYENVPEAVRAWVEEQQQDPRENWGRKWLFAVLAKPKHAGDQIVGTVLAKPTASAVGGGVEKVPVIEAKDKILVFPGGAIYEILPLWLAKGSPCERELHNLEKYKPQAADHSILAWVTDHTKPMRDLGRRDMTFTIEAMAVTETEDGKRARTMWERLHRAVKRNDRRMQREEREKNKKKVNKLEPDPEEEEEEYERDEL